MRRTGRMIIDGPRTCGFTTEAMAEKVFEDMVANPEYKKRFIWTDFYPGLEVSDGRSGRHVVVQVFDDSSLLLAKVWPEMDSKYFVCAVNGVEYAAQLIHVSNIEEWGPWSLASSS